MNAPDTQQTSKKSADRSNLALSGLAVAFLILAGLLFLNPWGHPLALTQHPLVDTNFLDTATVRQSYSDLLRAGEDVSGFDCYTCHDKKKTLTLTYDENHKLTMPKEHEDISMMHGQHERNNNCFNCHNESNLEQFQTRDGRELKLAESTALCGSCHGPTYRDWEAGAHGRPNGYWNKNLGARIPKDCVNCHNPHAPEYPGRKPAPPPHQLHEETASTASKSTHH